MKESFSSIKLVREILLTELGNTWLMQIETDLFCWSSMQDLMKMQCHSCLLLIFLSVRKISFRKVTLIFRGIQISSRTVSKWSAVILSVRNHYFSGFLWNILCVQYSRILGKTVTRIIGKVVFLLFEWEIRYKFKLSFLNCHKLTIIVF